MWYPDLMLVKVAAMRRMEAQRTGADPYARAVAMPVHRDSHLAVQVRRLPSYLGSHLVTWGRRLQRYGEPQTLLRQEGQPGGRFPQ